MNGISMSNGLMVGLNRSNISNQSRKLNIGSSKIRKDGSGYEASSYENFGVRTTRSSLNARWLRRLAAVRKGGAAGERSSKYPIAPSASAGGREARRSIHRLVTPSGE